jgi:ATP-dependent protease ClpP protease subunit
MYHYPTTKSNKLYAATYKLKHGIKRKRDRNDDDDDDDDNSELPITELLNQLKSDVYMIDNHLYFRTNVSIETIDKMNKLIIAYTRNGNILKEMHKGYDINTKPIYLHITSDGGDLFAGFYAVDIIKSSSVPIYTVVEGSAISAASLMACVGAKRYMTKNSYMLIHQLSSGVQGQFHIIKDNFENDTVLMDNIAKIYIEHSNKRLTKNKLVQILDHDKFWNFDLCKKNGLIDELYENII